MTRRVIEKNPDIQAKCILVLKNIYVYSPEEDKHYLNIVPQNIDNVITVEKNDRLSARDAQIMRQNNSLSLYL